MKISKVSADGVSEADGSYSSAILAEGTKVLYISGQVPDDLDAGPDVQIRQTLESMGKILETAGASFKNVVMMRSYFLNMERDLETFRKIRREFLAEPYPASTAIGVTELALKGQQFEVEATAIL